MNVYASCTGLAASSQLALCSFPVLPFELRMRSQKPHCVWDCGRAGLEKFGQSAEVCVWEVAAYGEQVMVVNELQCVCSSQLSAWSPVLLGTFFSSFASFLVSLYRCVLTEFFSFFFNCLLTFTAIWL